MAVDHAWKTKNLTTLLEFWTKLSRNLLLTLFLCYFLSLVLVLQLLQLLFPPLTNNVETRSRNLDFFPCKTALCMGEGREEMMRKISCWPSFDKSLNSICPGV